MEKDLEDALTAASNENINLRDEIHKLKKFKQYVHQRLDAIGVPHDPRPTRTLETGCRIEGRLDYLIQVTGGERAKLVNPNKKIY